MQATERLCKQLPEQLLKQLFFCLFPVYTILFFAYTARAQVLHVQQKSVSPYLQSVELSIDSGLLEVIEPLVPQRSQHRQISIYNPITLRLSVVHRPMARPDLPQARWVLQLGDLNKFYWAEAHLLRLEEKNWKYLSANGLLLNTQETKGQFRPYFLPLELNTSDTLSQYALVVYPVEYYSKQWNWDTLPIWLIPAHEHEKVVRENFFFLTFIAGALAIMALYNTGVYLYIRDYLYLNYVGFNLSVLFNTFLLLWYVYFNKNLSQLQLAPLGNVSYILIRLHLLAFQ